MEDIPKVSIDESRETFGKTRFIPRPPSIEESTRINEEIAHADEVFKKYEGQLVKIKIEPETSEDSEVVEDGWKVVAMEGKMIKVIKDVGESDNIKTMTKYISVKDPEALNH